MPFAACSSAGGFGFNCPIPPTVVPSCGNILCLCETALTACASSLAILTAGSGTVNLPVAPNVSFQLFVPVTAIHTLLGVAFFGHIPFASVVVVKFVAFGITALVAGLWGLTGSVRNLMIFISVIAIHAVNPVGPINQVGTRLIFIT